MKRIHKISQLLCAALVVCFSIVLVACSTAEADTPEVVELSAQDIYNLAVQSTVEINAESKNYLSTGTGFFDDSYGTVITNYHVIDGMTEATITCSDGSVYDVTGVAGYSEEMDIAVLSTSCNKSIPLLKRESSANTGENVYVLGSSLGLTGTFSEGIVSSAVRVLDGLEYIQITAPISQGNSGGPLLDANGDVMGIVSAAFIDGQNLNLAIPIDEASKIERNTPMSLEALCKLNSPYDKVAEHMEKNCRKFSLDFQDSYHDNIEIEDNTEFEISYIKSSEVSSAHLGLSFRVDFFDDDYHTDYSTGITYGGKFFVEIKLSSDEETCDIYTCRKESMATTDAEAFANSVLNGTIYSGVDFSTTINNYYISKDEYIQDSQAAVEYAIEVFDAWLYDNNVGCCAADFGF